MISDRGDIRPKGEDMEPNRSRKTAPEYRSAEDRLKSAGDEPVVINENRVRQAVPL